MILTGKPELAVKFGVEKIACNLTATLIFTVTTSMSFAAALSTRPQVSSVGQDTPTIRH